MEKWSLNDHNHTLLPRMHNIHADSWKSNFRCKNSENYLIDSVRRGKICKPSGSVSRSFVPRSSQDDLYRKLSPESNSLDHHRPVALSAIEPRSTSTGAAFRYSDGFHSIPGTSMFPRIDVLRSVYIPRHDLT